MDDNNLQPETKQCPYCAETILAVAKKCRYCREMLDHEHSTAPMTKEPVPADDNDMLKGEQAYQYAITEFIRQMPIEKKRLALFPNVTDKVLEKCKFTLDEGEVPLVAVTQRHWFAKKSWTALLITNRKIHYRVVNYHCMNMFHRRKTGAVRLEDVLKSDFDYAYFNQKGGYMGSPFYLNGELMGMIYIPEFMCFVIPTFDDGIIDWFQALFGFLAEVGLIQYAPSEADSNAGSALGSLIGKVLARL